MLSVTVQLSTPLEDNLVNTMHVDNMGKTDPCRLWNLSYEPSTSKDIFLLLLLQSGFHQAAQS